MAAKPKVLKKAKTVPVRRKRRVKISVPISTLTYGEKVVGVTFLPSQYPSVDEIRRLYAKIIDICNDEAKRSASQPSRHAILMQAIVQAMGAQMWAVKGFTYRG